MAQVSYSGFALIIGDRLQGELLSYCVDKFPEEACGLLVGSDSVVQGFVGLTNAAEHTYREFALDEMECKQALDKIYRDPTQRVVAVFHSHPGSQAYPSAIDVEWAATGVIQVIVAIPPHPHMRAFKILGSEVVPEPILES